MKRTICIALAAMILIVDAVTGHCINISTEEREALIEKAFSSKVSSYVEIITYDAHKIKGSLKQIDGKIFHVIGINGETILVDFDDIKKIRFDKRRAYDKKKLLKGIYYGTGLGLLFLLVMVGIGMNSSS